MQQRHFSELLEENKKTAKEVECFVERTSQTVTSPIDGA
jgi:hypothetical protein